MDEILKQLLSSDTETEILEFKQAQNQISKDKLGQYFSALSNEANLNGKYCAWLLFGIDNNKNIVGTIISDKQLNEYKREIANNTSPTLSFADVHRVVTEKGIVLIMYTYSRRRKNRKLK